MIPLLQKLGIGAVGALCLGVLKLIEANFYLSSADRSVAVGAYLTYLCYLVLGMAVACFFGENDPDAAKTRKSCFIMGLLAPSILIAIISKPHAFVAPAEPSQSIQPLSHNRSPLDIIFGSSAYAAEPQPDKAPAKAAAAAKPEIQVINASEIVGRSGLQEGIKQALGRSGGPSDYTYVMGSTDNKEKAIDYAAGLKELVSRQKGTPAPTVAIVFLEKDKKYLITAGDVGTRAEATRIKDDLFKTAAHTIESSPNASDKKTAITLLKGDVFNLAAVAK